MGLGMAAEEMLAWAALAFVLWLVITAAAHRLHLRAAAPATAALSWVVARALMWSLPPLLRWARAVVHAGTAWTSWS
jgi:hypothetical protein